MKNTLLSSPGGTVEFRVSEKSIKLSAVSRGPAHPPPPPPYATKYVCLTVHPR